MSLFDEIAEVFGGGRKESSLTLRAGTAEYHYFVSRGELEQRGNLAHGLEHLADLLALDPRRGEWLEMLPQYRRAAGGDLHTLLPEKKERYFATEAVRAWELHAQGRLAEAVSLLTQVVDAKPNADYLEAWGLEWLEPAGAVEALDPDIAVRFLMTALNRMPEHKWLIARRERDGRRLAALARRVAARTPKAMADMTVVGLHRKAGLFAEGAELARAAVQTRPSWHSYTALGLLLRESGAVQEAEACFAKAREHDSADLSALLEAGDMFFDRGEWAKARAYYEQVVGREPEHDWASPSALFCRWREGSDSELPDESFPELLYSLARAGNQRARQLFAPFHVYQGRLPAPRDATANALRRLLADSTSIRDGGTVRLALSDVEAPSNAVAFEVAMRARGYAVRLEIAYSHVAQPDPRQPVEPVAHELWRLEGESLVPALSPPPADVARCIRDLAAAPFERGRSWTRASRAAVQLGPDRVEAILGCIVHPPEMPAGRDPLLWVVGVQLCAAEVLAHLDPGWNDSVRRRALYSLLLGPRDWSTESAVVVLARLAWEEPAIGGDVLEAFKRLDAARPASGHVCYERQLLSQWANLPLVFPNEREALQRRIAALDED